MSKYALMLNASTDDVGPAANGLEYALDLDDGGHDVEVFLDGAATQWPGTVSENPDHPVTEYFESAMDRDLVAGACGFCAKAFEAEDGLDAAGVDRLSGPDEHAPNVSELVEDDYELLTIG